MMKGLALSEVEGFTLVEVLVVMGITSLIAAFLITNFSHTRTDLNQAMLTVNDAIREAQSLALAGSLVRGTYRCGYGIHFDATGYVIYAGPDSSAAGVDCTTQNRDYDTGNDIIVRQATLTNDALEFVLPIPDIFFEPPDPVTYIGNSRDKNVSTTVSLRRAGAACPSADCRSIYVSTSGRIQTQ